MNIAERAKITPADLVMETPRARYDGMGLKEARESLEKELLTTKTLAHNSGNLTKATTELGVRRPTLYDLMEKCGMPKE